MWRTCTVITAGNSDSMKNSLKRFESWFISQCGSGQRQFRSIYEHIENILLLFLLIRCDQWAQRHCNTWPPPEAPQLRRRKMGETTCEGILKLSRTAACIKERENFLLNMFNIMFWKLAESYHLSFSPIFSFNLVTPRCVSGLAV